MADKVNKKYIEAFGKFIGLEAKVSDTFMTTTYGRSIVDVLMSTIGLDVRGNLLCMSDAIFNIVEYEEQKRKFLFSLSMKSTTRLFEKLEN